MAYIINLVSSSERNVIYKLPVPILPINLLNLILNLFSGSYESYIYEMFTKQPKQTKKTHILIWSYSDLRHGQLHLFE